MTDAEFKEKLLDGLRKQLSTAKLVKTSWVNKETFQPTINLSFNMDLTVEMIQDARVAIGEEGLYAEIAAGIISKIRNIK